MTHRENILTKVIAIAKRNGFKIDDNFFTEVPASTWLQEGQDLYFSLVMDKHFAKCFWGEEDYMMAEGCEEKIEELNLEDIDNPVAYLMANRKNITILSWQYHLLQMAMSDDPLKYIEQFIEEKDNSKNITEEDI